MTQEDHISFADYVKKARAPKIITTNETVNDTFNRFKNKIKPTMKEGDNIGIVQDVRTHIG